MAIAGWQSLKPFCPMGGWQPVVAVPCWYVVLSALAGPCKLFKHNHSSRITVVVRFQLFKPNGFIWRM